MKIKNKKKIERDKGFIRSNCSVIEQTLKYLGITARVVEVNTIEGGNQFCTEVALGTKLEELLSYEHDIALAVASPTGKVVIEAPIPGKSLIGITIPHSKKIRSKKEKYKIIRIKEKVVEPSWLRKFVYLIAGIFDVLAFILSNVAEWTRKIVKNIS